MRFWKVGLLAAVLAVCGSPALQAGDALAGKWKVVILAFGNDEFFIVDVAKKDGALTGEVLASHQVVPNAKVGEISLKDGTLQMQIESDGQKIPFVGVVGAEARDKILGTLRFRGTLYPAHIEKTDANALARGDQKLIGSIFQAKAAGTAKQRVDQLGTIIHENKNLATLYHAYEGLLSNAEKAGLSSDDVKKYITQWLDEAKAHGPLWASQCRTNALAALNGQNAYAPLALDMATDAEKSLSADATLESKSELAKVVAWAANAVGKTELAKAAKERHEGFEAKLDDQYHKEVPPFAPQKFAGRKDEKHNRTVLFELFTGAQCPPCVAADVAFDGLLKTYKSSELVTLQYHLHIPGPDPLTNEASTARAKYYGVSSTPTPLFNGKKEAQGGGGMAGSEAKYQEYRGVIDRLLEDFTPVNIKLDAQPAGDTIVVNAFAQSKQEGNLRLRVVLTEESIRYIGSNRLRFHHHVVRAMPGGPDGTAFDKGASSMQLKVNLPEIRKELNAYLDGYAEKRPFPRERPEIRLQGLALVAFVQNDDTKEVLHAVAVPLSQSEK